MLSLCYYLNEKTYFCNGICILLYLMRNRIGIKKIYVFTFVGLVGASALQSIWLHNTYTLIKNNIEKESYAIIEKALEEEGNIRFGQTPKGTEIMGGVANDTIPPMTYFYEQLSDMGYPLSMQKLDSIISQLLIEGGIKDLFSIHIINLHTGEIVQSNRNNEASSWMTVKPKYLPIRSDYTQVVQLILVNPYKTFVERMGLLIIATIIILSFVIGCIVYQIRMIYRMNKIARIREDFSYALIHDMKSPLSSIFMILNFLHSGKLDGKPEMKEKYYQIAENEAEHLLVLTNKVLTISKLENHKQQMNKEKVLLTPILKELADKYLAQSTKEVHFAFDLKVKEVYAEAEYLKEIFSNLIDNAIKYSKESVEIRISSENHNSSTVIRVHDNGLGIADKYQRCIFNKYERGAAERRIRKGGAAGFGLGLNFVQQVIEAHGGNITVNSIEKEYTEFIIYLPNREDSAEEVDSLEVLTPDNSLKI
ncbi:MAG: HAMP domain-containing histidine kinase [Bacteroides sp.]|nr:HAMP domain-containing histidine kinase [Bacteroides sp.]